MGKLTQREADIIDRHCSECLTAAELARRQLMQINKGQRSPIEEGQITYWKNVASGMRWAIQVAKQSVSKGVDNGKKPL